MLSILFLIQFISVLSTIYNKNIFLKKNNAYTKLLQLSNNKLKDPIILNGNKTPLKKDLCNIICEDSNLKFQEFTFDKFIYEKPHLNYENNLLYISDYLIGNGRILSQYEFNSLLEIPQTSNLIVLEAENLNTIPYNDINLNRRFEKVEFPIIKKIDIIRYISELIICYNYNDDLLLLNWINYNIEILNIEQINIFLFKLNNMLNENNNIRDIKKSINLIIDELF